jgi:hypothetical protein
MHINHPQPPQHPHFRSLFASSLLALFGAAACDKYPLHDLGYTEGEVSVDPPPTEPPRAEFTSDFDGIWIGEADDLFAPAGLDTAYTFPSGSRRILLELDADPASSEAGRITFGASPGPAPATDPELGYPPDPGFSIERASAFDATIEPPTEGFVYTLSGGLSTGRDLTAVGLEQLDFEGQAAFFDAGRVFDGMHRLNFIPAEVYTSWCARCKLRTASPGTWGWSRRMAPAFMDQS